MPFIFSLLTGAVGKYLLIGVAALAFMTWIRHDAAAPYKREVVVLREAAANKERLAKVNERRAVEAETKRQQYQQRLQVLIDETNSQGGACKLSDIERQRLLSLAAGNG